MATLGRVESQIERLEGFRVAFVTLEGRNLRGDRIGIPGYSGRFENRAPGRMTVERWKKGRFHQVYPGFTVEVLLGDGARARGNTRLGTVRNSYFLKRVNRT
jgi:hypothetical protein